jgi:hypothetical protein
MGLKDLDTLLTFIGFFPLIILSHTSKYEVWIKALLHTTFVKSIFSSVNILLFSQLCILEISFSTVIIHMKFLYSMNSVKFKKVWKLNKRLVRFFRFFFSSTMNDLILSKVEYLLMYCPLYLNTCKGFFSFFIYLGVLSSINSDVWDLNIS